MVGYPLIPSAEHSLLFSSQLTATTLSLFFIRPARSDHAADYPSELLYMSILRGHLLGANFLQLRSSVSQPRSEGYEEKVLTGRTYDNCQLLSASLQHLK